MAEPKFQARTRNAHWRNGTPPLTAHGDAGRLTMAFNGATVEFPVTVESLSLGADVYGEATYHMTIRETPDGELKIIAP